MIYKIQPAAGLKPLGINRSTRWKKVAPILTIAAVIGFFFLACQPNTTDGEQNSLPAKNPTELNNPNDSAELDASEPIREVNVRLSWKAKVDLDLIAFYTTTDGTTGQVDYRNKAVPGIQLDTDAGVGDRGGRKEENLRITALDNFREIWFATFIFSKGGSYSDYDGYVTVKTNNGDDIQVPLTSREQKPYLLIAKVATEPGGTIVTNLNDAVECEELDPILGTKAGCVPIQPKPSR